METNNKLKRKQDSNDSSNKKVRFDNVTSVSHFTSVKEDNRSKKYNNEIIDNEDDDIEDFEKLKTRRRGRVNLDGYNSDSDSDDYGNEDEKDIFAEEGEDEVFNKKKKQKSYMKRSDIQGEEWINPGDDEYDEEQEKMEPFNMDKDLEEGDFDENGHYISKKDKNQIYDNWLQGVTQSDINKAKAAHEAKEAKLKEEDEKEDQNIKQNELYKALIMIMKPKETLLNSMKRLGGTTKKVPKWKQKMLAKKSKATDKGTEVSEANKKSIEAITAIAEKMMSFGNYSIYEENYESIVRKLRIAEELEDDWKPGDKIEISQEVLKGIPEVGQAIEQ